MSTNTNKAADVIDAALPVGSHITRSFGKKAAKALADAGLLMPDLPEPEFKFSGGACWLDSGNASVESHYYSDSHVYVITTGVAYDLTPTEAKQFAYALLAAVNHAEKDHAND